MLIEKEINVETDINYSVVKICSPNNFDIDKVFDCGQCFRFNKIEHSAHEIEYSGVAFGKFVSFAQDGNDLYIYNATQEDYELIWKRYLSLDVDYEDIEESILSCSGNKDLKKAIEYSRGIRILRQDNWEAICSFIISQNNNIPRIKKIIENLSSKCGTYIPLSKAMNKHRSPACANCSFPTPEQIIHLGIDGLIELKTGFRAKYIYDAAQKIVSGKIDLNIIYDQSTNEAIKYLCNIKGIGPKVAACALLFGFEKYDAFPVDVWIKKVISKYFITEDAPNFDSDSLGKYAGVAQQFLFYYERYGGYKE